MRRLHLSKNLINESDLERTKRKGGWFFSLETGRKGHVQRAQRMERCKEFSDWSGKRMWSVLMKDEKPNTKMDTEIEVT